ncbi:hypothetical protein Tco_0698791 [Tanacetum coccineum]
MIYGCIIIMSSQEKTFDVEAIRKKKVSRGNLSISLSGLDMKRRKTHGSPWNIWRWKKRRTGRTLAFELPEMLVVDTSFQAWIPEIQDQYVGPSYEIIEQRTTACILFQKGECEKGAKCPFRHEKLLFDI